jgi:hypothetical protein
MNIESAGVPSPMPAASADRVVPRAVSTARVRACRQRRRLGVHYVKVPVSRTIIEALVRLAYLSEDLQQDVSAIQRAVQNYVADAQYLP